MSNVKELVSSTVEITPSISVDIAQYQPTGRPIEDRFSTTFDQASNRLLLGVYDGHGGVATAHHVSTTLPVKLLQYPPSRHSTLFEELDNSMLTAFMNDHSLFRSRSENWVAHAEVVKSGCTALIFDIDLNSMLGSFANAGDCRLVVCNSSKNYVRQTVDLNAKATSEVERLQQQHPGEDMLIVSGRLFGKVMSTRGFGDGYYKLPRGGLMGNRKHRKYIDILSSIEPKNKIPMNAQYDSYFYGYQTPPYITAAPEVGTLPLETGDVVIMASDGLWDLISSDDAANIVLAGVASGETRLATYLLERVIGTQSPGDDVTILVLQL